MKVKLILICFAFLFSACNLTTDKTQDKDERLAQIGGIQMQQIALAVTANDEILRSIGQTKEIIAAREFNKLSISYTGYTPSYEEVAGMGILAAQFIAGDKDAVDRVGAKFTEAGKLATERQLLESELKILKKDLYRNARQWEEQNKNKVWDKVKGVFGGSIAMIAIAGIGYILIVTGALPFLLKMLASKFPKLAYSTFGLVRKETFDKLVVGIGEYRKQKKKIISSGEDVEKKAAQRELEEIDQILKEKIHKEEGEQELIENIRQRKGM
jgi:hypothetical protein